MPAYTFMPFLREMSASADIWLSVFVAVFYIALFSAPLLIFRIKFKEKSLVEAFKAVAGNAVAKAIAVLYVLILIINFTVFFSYMLRFAGASVLQETPVWAIALVILVPVTYAICKGGGAIARISLYIVPFVLASLLLFALFGVKAEGLKSMLPVGASGFKNIHFTGFLMASQFSEIIVFFVFASWLNKDKKIIKSYALTLTIFLIASLFIIIPIISVLGFNYAKITPNPYYVFTRQVVFYPTIEKFQSINTLITIPAGILKLSAYGFTASLILKELLPKVKREILSISLAVIIFVLSLLPIVSRAVFSPYGYNVLSYITIGAYAGIPLLLMPLLVRRTKRTAHNERLIQN